MLFRQYRVHHSSPDGVLVQLPGDGGFGRLTRDTLGGDALAERLLKSFATRQLVPAALRRSRDAQGYRLLTVHLHEAWSGLLHYPPAVRQLVSRLLRKHLLVGLGTTTAARLVKATDKGLVLQLTATLSAVAAWERVPAAHALPPSSTTRAAAHGDDVAHDENNDDDDARETTAVAADVPGGASTVLEVRLLDYDVARNVVAVTAQPAVVERTPIDTAVAASVLARLVPGTLVQARVLLSSTSDDDGVAVVEVFACGCAPRTRDAHDNNDDDDDDDDDDDGVGSSHSAALAAAAAADEERDEAASRCSVLGYYLYKWPSGDAHDGGSHNNNSNNASTTTAVPPVVGALLTLRVEFVAEHAALREWLPFVVLSQRRPFHALPAIRRQQRRRSRDACHCARDDDHNTDTCAGLLGYLPWRDPHVRDDDHGNNNDDDDSDKDVYSDDDDDAAAARDGEAAHRNKAAAVAAATRVRRRRLEEAMDAYERNLDTAVPASPDEFQRLLLATPNNSYVWMQYMAHHVALQQYEEARQVAEKALQTIGAREQAERLNVWVAYLNLENLHGTTESLAAVFKRALRYQAEPLVLHERLADIFAASRKHQQLLALCRAMTSKFRAERRTWERLGVVLIDQDKRDQLKRVLKDMSTALRKDDAALAIVHMAVHEYKLSSHGGNSSSSSSSNSSGNPVEHARALLEGLLAKLPKKSDVWSIYLDQELALLRRGAAEASVRQVRSLFERAVTMGFSTKVMQQLLTRFLDFERAHGSASDVEKVKERARAYVEAKIHAVTSADATTTTTATATTAPPS